MKPLRIVTIECPQCGEPVVSDMDLSLNDDGTLSCHCSACQARWRHNPEEDGIPQD